jgi:hypothetical protein
LVLITFCFIVTGKSQEASPLFTCETDRAGKYLSIVGIEHGPDELWTDVQYRFGYEGKAEMVFPDDATLGAQSIFFSHEYRNKGVYRVTLRFVRRGFTYRVFSNAIGERGDGDAGVIVTDRAGRVRSRISCIERPYMFPGYLQRTLACDLKNPHGRAACQPTPYRPPRR